MPSLFNSFLREFIQDILYGLVANFSFYFAELKEKRRSHEQGNRESFLRIGSLNVRVKKTTEAFGNFLGKSNSSASIERILHKNWGSADNIPEAEVSKIAFFIFPHPDLTCVKLIIFQFLISPLGFRKGQAVDAATIHRQCCTQSNVQSERKAKSKKKCPSK